MPPAPAPAPAGMPLAWRLALLATALLVAAVGVLLYGTRTVLYDSAESRARTRLESAARELAALSEASSAARVARVAALVRQPDFRALAGAGGDTAAIADRLRALKVHAPDTASVELWDRDGRPLLTVGDPVADARALPPRELAPDSSWASPITTDARGAHIWTVVAVAGTTGVTPVEQAPRPVAYVAMHRRVLGSRNLSRQVGALSGDSVRVRLRNRDGSAWIEAWGESVRAPVRRDSGEHGIRFLQADGRRAIAAEAPVRRTPWLVVLEMPETSVFAAPRRTMQRLALLGVLVVLAGATLAWVVGRRIASPLAAITDASTELAHGTYEHAIVRERGDEIGRLAQAFDSMARQVVSARRELEQRAADAQALATRLTEANHRLTYAMREAEEARTTAEQARRAAEEASRAKSDFLAVMSHELRTPLNAIGGYAELLEMEIRGPVTAQQREDLVRIRRSQRHLLSLIDDVLGFARIDAGKVEFTFRDVPLAEALADVDALVAPQAAARGVALVLEPAPAGLVVRADVEKARQVVVNLLANAIKFTPAGGRVTLSCTADERRACIHVRDTGPGIPPERLERIFEPFEQGNRALNRPAEGVGLGLTISRDLARGMGGTVTVESVPGDGATFTFVVPRATIAAPAAAAGSPSLAPHAAA